MYTSQLPAHCGASWKKKTISILWQQRMQLSRQTMIQHQFATWERKITGKIWYQKKFAEHARIQECILYHQRYGLVEQVWQLSFLFVLWLYISPVTDCVIWPASLLVFIRWWVGLGQHTCCGSKWIQPCLIATSFVFLP